MVWGVISMDAETELLMFGRAFVYHRYPRHECVLDSKPIGDVWDELGITVRRGRIPPLPETHTERCGPG